MNKKAETFFFSTTGVIAAFAVIILVNFIFTTARWGRMDLTEDKVYTLSEGTKNILKNLDTPVTIRYYLTRNDPNVPAMIKNYASQVEDLLHEYRQHAKKFIKIQKLDPQPDTEAAESADLDGISGHTLPNGDKFYCGLAFTCLDQKEAIAYLDFNRERLLEYDVSRAISRVMTDEKPVIGVMSALPVMGTKPTMQMMQAGQFQGAPEWLAVTELKSDFDVKEVEMTATEIPEDVDVLVVIHPKGITEGTEYAIDQFVLGGGKLIAMVDPLSIADPAGQQRNPMMGGGPPQTSSSLDKLFEGWGVKFSKTQVVADKEFLTKLGGQGGRPVDNPTFLSVSAEGLNTNDIATAQIGSLLLPFAGSFTGTPTDGLSQTVLLHSSTVSKNVEAFLARMQGAEILKDFKADGDQKSLAIRLSGKFKTAFPDGKPGDPHAADAKPDDEKKDETAQLKEAAEDNHVVLIADADMLVDQFCVRQMPNPFGARVFMPVSANINLLQNIVEQMAGDNNLINSRSRATRDRRFTVLSKMRDEAAKEQQAKVKELEDSEREIATKLRELLGQMGQGDQTVMVDKSLSDKIKKFKEDQVAAKRKLREVKKELRRDIVALENGLKLANILGMPAIVIVIGLLVGLIKRQKTAAK
jgi:ABC-type uncharacterized transport system involved in gliding motility auxiliary subunit